MANETDEIQTTVVAGTAGEVEAQVTAIEAEGGTLVSVRVTAPADERGTVEVEITHTS